MWRDGAIRQVSVRIASQPRLDPDEVETELGFHVQEINEYIARDHRLDSTDGAFVSFVAPGSPAREAGLRIGDVIIRIEAVEIDKLDDLQEALQAAKPLERFLVVARRGEETLFMLLKPGVESSEEDSGRTPAGSTGDGEDAPGQRAP